MSRNKKNLLSLAALLVVLVICIVLYLLVPKGTGSDTDDSDSDSSSQSEDITVESIASDKIEKFEFLKDGKTAYSLVRDGDDWKLSGHKNLPLDSDKVTALFDCLAPVSASKKLDQASDLKDYGLDDPSYTVKVTADGKKYQFDLGIQVPVEGGYYGTDQNDPDTVYCLSESMVSDLDVDTNTLVTAEEIAQPEEDNMTLVSVKTKKGVIFEAENVKKADRVDSSVKWNITKPYKKPQAPDSDNWSTTLGYFNSMTLGDLVDYDAKDHMEKYGLENPASVITVQYKKSKKNRTITLYVGKKTDDSYYVRQKDSDSVYKMDADSVENMTKINAYEVMEHTVYGKLANEVDGFDAIYGTTKLHAVRTEKKVTKKKSDDSDETEETTEDVWELNGKVVSSDNKTQFLVPYSSMGLLEYSGVAENSVKPKNKKEVLTVVYHEGKKDVTIRFYPYDGTNFYRVDKDGCRDFLVDKRSVDRVISRFKKIEDITK